MGGIHKYHNINGIDILSIRNGSTIINLTLNALTALTGYFEISNSSVDMLTIGKAHIKEIKLHNEIIGKCSISDVSIDCDNIAKWMLVKKSAVQNGDRIHYLDASYMINKKYSNLEKQWLRKIMLKIFSLICGYGYKPLRTVVSSIFLIIFWRMIYWIVGLLLPGSFYKCNTLNAHSLYFIDYIYYSGITYTTTGYGDIVPVNDIIKILSIIEAITGVSMLSLFVFSLTKSRILSVISN